MVTTLSKSAVEIAVSEIFGRGVGTFIDPNDTFRKKLIAKATGEYSKEIIIKFGMDPTRPDIHLGHAVVLRKLRQLQDLGCKVVFLIGDFTTLIGDPTGKSKVRPELDFATVMRNMESYIAQVDKILLINKDAEGNIVDGPLFSWMRNSDWFFGVTDISTEGASQLNLNIKDEMSGQSVTVSSSSFIGKAALFENTRMQKTLLNRPTVQTVSAMNLLSVLRRITYSQLLERDMFQDRVTNKEPLFMHEMVYPVAQGIDSDLIAQIYGSCDLEVGGTDQTFNLLMGRKVMEMTAKEPQAILSFTLLVGTDGKEKMSKSLDNYIGITDVPADMFGKIMSLPDALLESYFELCTFTPMDEVKKIIKELESEKLHPKDIKMNLAQQIVEIYHGRSAGESAREAFIETFQKRGIPNEIREFTVTKSTALMDALLNAEIVASKTEFRRLITEGALRRDGEIKITDATTILTEDMVIKIGKHRFIKIIVE